MLNEALWLVFKGIEFGFVFGVLLMLFAGFCGYCVSSILEFFDHISGRKL